MDFAGCHYEVRSKRCNAFSSFSYSFLSFSLFQQSDLTVLPFSIPLSSRESSRAREPLLSFFFSFAACACSPLPRSRLLPWPPPPPARHGHRVGAPSYSGARASFPPLSAAARFGRDRGGLHCGSASAIEEKERP